MMYLAPMARGMVGELAIGTSFPWSSLPIVVQLMKIKTCPPLGTHSLMLAIIKPISAELYFAFVMATV